MRCAGVRLGSYRSSSPGDRGPECQMGGIGGKAGDNEAGAGKPPPEQALLLVQHLLLFLRSTKISAQDVVRRWVSLTCDSYKGLAAWEGMACLGYVLCSSSA